MKASSKIVLIMVLMIALLSISCKSALKDDFLDSDEKVSGGINNPNAGMNIKDIDISFIQDQTEIALHIVYGSREETQSEAIITNLPKYEVFVLDEPYRLGIRLYGIEYVDYLEKQNWALDEHIIGVFRERVSNKDYTTVYFQLRGNVKYRVVEGDGKIRILLDDENADKQDSHFVMLNAFDEYLEGFIGEDYGLSPVLCSDGMNISMISKPFNTSEKAEEFLAVLNGKVAKSAISKKPYSLTLAGDILPIFNSEIDVFLPENKKMVVEDSIAMVLPMMFENGKYVVESDERIVFVKPYIATEGDLNYSGEQLWVLENFDKKEKLDLPPFNYIISASFSKDGRYLGFIDIGIDNKVLYVYDFVSKNLYNLGEEGFGIFTSSFCWADDSNTIYAITGNDTIQLSKCSFSETGLEINALIEESEGEGKIADFGDEIIFADNFAGEFGIIYSINKFSGKKEFLTEGIDFKISPDKTSMAVIQQKQLSEESSFVTLKLYSMVDSSETIIEEGGIIESYDYLPSSNTLIYSDGTVSDYTYRFNYGLLSYDVNTGIKNLISHMSSGEFFLSKSDAEIYLLNHNIGLDGKYSFTTYIYSIEDVVKG